MRKNQLKAGVVLSYVSECVKIITNLIYTPIMLRLLGKSEYGLYQLVYSVVSYLSLLSLGFGSAYIRYYSKYKAENDDDGVARLNGMFMTIFCAISMICLLCGFIMVLNIKSIFASGLTDAEYVRARILMILMIINLALTFPATVFNCNVTAHEKFIFQKTIIVLQNILNPFLCLPLLIMGAGSVGMVLVTTGLTIGKLLINSWYCFKKLHIRFLFKGFKLSLLKEMFTFTFFIFLNQIINQINWSVDKFLLGRLAGTTAVAVYGVGGTINNMYLQASLSISNVFTPRVHRLVANNQRDTELTVLFTRVGRLQFMLLSLVLTGFVFLGQPFISFWAGEGYSESYLVAILLITPCTVPLIQNIGIEIQRAKNKHKARSVVYFAIAVGNVLVSIPLIKYYGPIGAALGTTIALVLGNVFFMNWYYHNRLDINVIYFWKNIVSFLPSFIVPTILGIIIMKYIPVTSFVRLFILAIAYSVVYAVSFWILGMNDSEKDLLRNVLKKLRRGR